LPCKAAKPQLGKSGSRIRLGFKGKKIVGKNIPPTHPDKPGSNFPALNLSSFVCISSDIRFLSCAEPRPWGMEIWQENYWQENWLRDESCESSCQ
jgi:hypothetical protein